MGGISVSFKSEYKSHKAERMKEARDWLDKGMLKATLLVEREAKKGCPVDTARLRSSITSSVFHEGLFKQVGKVGTDVEYASYVEFGTSRMSAQPFLFPALRMFSPFWPAPIMPNVSPYFYHHYY